MFESFVRKGPSALIQFSETPKHPAPHPHACRSQGDKCKGPSWQARPAGLGSRSPCEERGPTTSLGSTGHLARSPPTQQQAHTALGWLSLLVKRALSVAKAGFGRGGGGSFPFEELPLDLDGEHPVAHGKPLTNRGADMLLAGGWGDRAGRGAARKGCAAGTRASLACLLRLLG